MSFIKTANQIEAERLYREQLEQEKKIKIDYIKSINKVFSLRPDKRHGFFYILLTYYKFHPKAKIEVLEKYTLVHIEGFSICLESFMLNQDEMFMIYMACVYLKIQVPAEFLYAIQGSDYEYEKSLTREYLTYYEKLIGNVFGENSPIEYKKYNLPVTKPIDFDSGDEYAKFEFCLCCLSNLAQRIIELDKVIFFANFPTEPKDFVDLCEELYAKAVSNLQEKNYSKYYFLLDCFYIELNKEQYFKGLRFYIYFGLGAGGNRQFWLAILNIEPVGTYLQATSKFRLVSGFSQVFKEFNGIEDIFLYTEDNFIDFKVLTNYLYEFILKYYDQNNELRKELESSGFTQVETIKGNEQQVRKFVASLEDASDLMELIFCCSYGFEFDKNTGRYKK